MVVPRRHWYGVDPIHIRFRYQGEAWQTMIDSDGVERSKESFGRSLRDRFLYIGCVRSNDGYLESNSDAHSPRGDFRAEQRLHFIEDGSCTAGKENLVKRAQNTCLAIVSTLRTTPLRFHHTVGSRMRSI